LVAFEIARRHRFIEEMAQIPDGIEVHVLPSGMETTPSVNLRYRDAHQVAARIEAARVASTHLLDRVSRPA
jgi:NTE family protein